MGLLLLLLLLLSFLLRFLLIMLLDVVRLCVQLLLLLLLRRLHSSFQTFVFCISLCRIFCSFWKKEAQKDLSFLKTLRTTNEEELIEKESKITERGEAKNQRR